MGLGYNKNVLYPRPITLAKRYLRFYRCHEPYLFDKTSKFLLYLILINNGKFFVFFSIKQQQHYNIFFLEIRLLLLYVFVNLL